LLESGFTPGGRGDDLFERMLDEINLFKTAEATPTSINVPIGDGEGSELGDLIPNENAPEGLSVLEDVERRELVGTLILAAAEHFNKTERGRREWDILYRRKLHDGNVKQTLQVLADDYGLTRERVRQIEVKAFEKFKKFAKNNFSQAVSLYSGGEPEETGMRAGDVIRMSTRKSAPA